MHYPPFLNEDTTMPHGKARHTPTKAKVSYGGTKMAPKAGKVSPRKQMAMKGYKTSHKKGY